MDILITVKYILNILIRKKRVASPSDHFNQQTDIDPQIIVTPGHINEGLTPALIVECSLENLAVYDAVEILLLELSHDFNGTGDVIAQFNGNDSLTATSDDIENNIIKPGSGWKVVSSYFQKSKAIYLAIKLMFPTARESGTYTCDISVKNETVTHIVKRKTVTSSVPSRQDLYDKFIDQETLLDYFLFACDFENGLCGLNVSSTSDLTGWTIMPDRMRGQGRHFDSYKKDAFGHYLHLDQYSLYSSGKPFTIETKLLPPIRRPVCFNFWMLVNGNLRIMNMYTKQNGTLTNFYSHGGVAMTGFWNVPWTLMENLLPPSDNPFTIVIEVEGSYWNAGFLAIDDIIITDFNCYRRPASNGPSTGR